MKGKLRQYYNEALLMGFSETHALQHATLQVMEEDRAKRLEIYHINPDRINPKGKGHGHKRPSSR